MTETKTSIFERRAHLADSLPPDCSPAEGIILTKDAGLLRTAIVTPSDLSFRDDATFANRLKILNNSFRHIADTGWSFHLHIHRSQDASFTYKPQYDKSAPAITKALEERRALLAPFHTTSIYITVCRSLAPELASWKGYRFDAEEREKNGYKTIRYHMAHFIVQTDDFFAQLSNVFERLEIATTSQALTYIHGALSGNYHPVLCPSPASYLDTYLADEALTTHPELKYGDEHILVASPFAFPGKSNTALVAELLSLPETFDLVTRFEFASPEAARHEIKSARDAAYKKRKGMKTMIEEAATKTDAGPEDTDALALTADAGRALADLANQEVFFGHMATTLVIRDRDSGSANARLDSVKKIINRHGYVVKNETLNAADAFLAILPGNLSVAWSSKLNPRRPMLKTRNLAHSIPISAPWTGEHTNKHIAALTGCTAPHIVCKTGCAPFFLNLNVGDVGHTLVVGPTGAGKSTLLALLMVFWLKIARVRVVCFDKDRSAYWPTINSGGVHINVGDDSPLRFNPFAHIDTKSDQAVITQLIAEYLELKGIPVPPKDQQTLFDAVVSVSKLPLQNRAWETYSDSIQDQDLRDALSPFVRGEYAQLFTRGDDPIAESRWLTFEMGPLMHRDQYIVQFILSYLFFRVEQTFSGDPVLLVLDEAWFFLDNEIFAAKMREWLKVLRKKNVYVVLATQEVADAQNSTIFSTIVNACFTKILLPNPNAGTTDFPLYRLIGLGDIHIHALVNAAQKQDYLYFSEKGAQLFRFDLGPEEIAFLRGQVYVNEPQEVSG